MSEITGQPYRERRERLLEACDAGLVLVRGAGAEGPNPNFFYLTGIEEPQAMLLLARAGIRIGTGRRYPGPDYVRGRMAQQLLFLPPHDELAARWGEAGSATTRTIAAGQVGVDAVLGTPEAGPLLAQELRRSERLHFVRGYPAALDGRDDDASFVARIRERFFHLRVDDATATVHEMRRDKDADEVRQIEHAVGVVAQVLDAAIERVRPGVKERELEAEITRVYRAHSGTHAFDPIVASGANALLLHYRDNAGRLEAGDLLLIDTGASIDGYKADISRTFPVDGRFTDRQRQVYDVVLDAERQVIDAVRPGGLIGDLHARAYEAIDRAGFAEHFPHGTSHHLGLETHDVGDLHRPLVAGNVITVEPGIYLRDESLGVRIEDDVVLTEDGCRILSEAIPRSAEEIERRMAACGR